MHPSGHIEHTEEDEDNAKYPSLQFVQRLYSEHTLQPAGQLVQTPEIL